MASPQTGIFALGTNSHAYLELDLVADAQPSEAVARIAALREPRTTIGGVNLVPPDMTVVERGDVLRAKPEPDLFLACQERLGVEIRDCYVVGDAVWDLLAARRAGMLSVGLLTGGYGEDELLSAGAFRVYRGADELLDAIDELGI
jgi:beta-phosphoglucomutase-like phosphatase (HAD superfamily)